MTAASKKPSLEAVLRSMNPPTRHRTTAQRKAMQVALEEFARANRVREEHQLARLFKPWDRNLKQVRQAKKDPDLARKIDQAQVRALSLATAPPPVVGAGPGGSVPFPHHCYLEFSMIPPFVGMESFEKSVGDYSHSAAFPEKGELAAGVGVGNVPVGMHYEFMPSHSEWFWGVYNSVETRLWQTFYLPGSPITKQTSVETTISIEGPEYDYAILIPGDEDSIGRGLVGVEGWATLGLWTYGPALHLQSLTKKNFLSSWATGPHNHSSTYNRSTSLSTRLFLKPGAEAFALVVIVELWALRAGENVEGGGGAEAIFLDEDDYPSPFFVNSLTGRLKLKKVGLKFCEWSLLRLRK